MSQNPFCINVKHFCRSNVRIVNSSSAAMAFKISRISIMTTSRHCLAFHHSATFRIVNSSSAAMAFRISPMSIMTTSRHCLAFHHSAAFINPRHVSPQIPKRFTSCIKGSAQISPLVDNYAVQMQSQNVVEILEERGLIETMTHQDLRSACSNPDSKPLKVYCGFDPTAESLHLGNLLGIIVLTWFQKCGHVPVALVGGATARVGDPSGKSFERPVLDEETIRRNSDGIRAILERILGQENNRKALIMNNYDWWKEFKVLDFLRDVGKYARVGTMMAKESVRKRLNSDEGMSFTEFSYQLLQGYDFLHLFKNAGVSVQIGGSDQWGNITAGTDLIRKVLQQEGAYGLTFPLLLKSDGTKFGKSEEGAIWLSPSMLSPYKFYQHIIGTADADVIVFLKKLTFLPMEEILSLKESVKQPGYVPNTLQRRLAEEVTRFVHGEEGLQEARKATEALAPGSKTRLDWRTLEVISNDVPSLSLSYNEVLKSSLVDLSVKGGLLETKSAVRRLIRQGGFYLNNERVESEGKIIEPADIVDDKMLLLSAGKKNKMVVKIA